MLSDKHEPQGVLTFCENIFSHFSHVPLVSGIVRVCALSVILCYTLAWRIDKSSLKNGKKMILFKYFRLLWSVSSECWAGTGADKTVFHKIQETICFYSCVLNSFCFLLRSWLAGSTPHFKFMKNVQF